jgi:hypothetical protein
MNAMASMPGNMNMGMGGLQGMMDLSAFQGMNPYALPAPPTTGESPLLLWQLLSLSIANEIKL